MGSHSFVMARRLEEGVSEKGGRDWKGRQLRTVPSACICDAVDNSVIKHALSAI